MQRIFFHTILTSLLIFVSFSIDAMDEIDEGSLPTGNPITSSLSDWSDEADSSDSSLAYDEKYPLHAAASLGKLPKAKKFIKTQQSKINEKDHLGQTPLFKAVLLKNKELVDVLLKKKAQPNFFDNNGNCPLAYSIVLGDKDTSLTLLKAQAFPMLARSNRWGPLHLAAMFKTDEELIQRLLKAGAEPLWPALASYHSLDEWIDMIVERWVGLSSQVQRLSELVAARNKDYFTSLIKEKDNVSDARNAFLNKIGSLKEGISNKKFLYSLALYDLLIKNAMDIRWPAKASGEKKIALWQFCKCLDQNFGARSSYFRKHPEFDFDKLSHWAGRVMQALDESDLPPVDGIDWQEVKKWFAENKKAILQAKLKQEHKNFMEPIMGWQTQLEAFMSSLKKWDLLQEHPDQKKFSQWATFIATAIINNNLSYTFAIPHQSSFNEGLAWIKKLKIAARHEAPQEFLVVPFIDMRDERALQTLNRYRSLVSKKLVRGILILPDLAGETPSSWARREQERYLFNATMSSEVSIEGSSTKFKFIAHSVLFGVNAESFEKVIGVDYQDLKREGFFITLDTEDRQEPTAEEFHDLLRLVSQQCDTFDCHFLILDDVFSASFFNESTRKVLEKYENQCTIGEVLRQDFAGHDLKTNRLVVSGDEQFIADWFEYLEMRVSENEKNLQKLSSVFKRQAIRECKKYSIISLFAENLPLKESPSLGLQILSALVEAGNIRSIQKEVNVGEFVQLAHEAIIERASIDLRSLIYYQLVEQGYLLSFKKRTTRSFADWASLVTKNVPEGSSEKVKNFLIRQSLLYCYEHGEGINALDMAGFSMEHYSAQMPDIGEFEIINNQEVHTSTHLVKEDRVLWPFEVEPDDLHKLNELWPNIENELKDSEPKIFDKPLIVQCGTTFYTDNQKKSSSTEAKLVEDDFQEESWSYFVPSFREIKSEVVIIHDDGSYTLENINLPQIGIDNKDMVNNRKQELLCKSIDKRIKKWAVSKKTVNELDRLVKNIQLKKSLALFEKKTLANQSFPSLKQKWESEEDLVNELFVSPKVQDEVHVRTEFKRNKSWHTVITSPKGKKKRKNSDVGETKISPTFARKLSSLKLKKNKKK